MQKPTLIFFAIIVVRTMTYKKYIQNPEFLYRRKNIRSWVGWMTSFNTFVAMSSARASAWWDEGQYFSFIKKRIWNFLCLLSAQLFSLHSKGPWCGQKWETLPGNHFKNNFPNFTVKKINSTVPLHVPSSINRKYDVATIGTPFEIRCSFRYTGLRRLTNKKERKKKKRQTWKFANSWRSCGRHADPRSPVHLHQSNQRKSYRLRLPALLRTILAAPAPSVEQTYNYNQLPLPTIFDINSS